MHEEEINKIKEKLPPDPIYLIPEINELINKSLILISDISPGIKFEEKICFYG